MKKIEFISRLLVLVEPGLNMIELGPKGTGKSYVYNNISMHTWVVSGGKISRAKLFYNKSNRQFGIMKHYDLVAIDEISSFGFVDPDEMQSIFKGYLEAGSILQGLSIDSEYISSVFHKLRTTSDYELIFDKLVEYEKNCDLRDLKAVRRVSTAYHKLLFPHITNLCLVLEKVDRKMSTFSRTRHGEKY